VRENVKVPLKKLMPFLPQETGDIEVPASTFQTSQVVRMPKASLSYDTFVAIARGNFNIDVDWLNGDFTGKAFVALPENRKSSTADVFFWLPKEGSGGDGDLLIKHRRKQDDAINERQLVETVKTSLSKLEAKAGDPGEDDRSASNTNAILVLLATRVTGALSITDFDGGATFNPGETISSKGKKTKKKEATEEVVVPPGLRVVVARCTEFTHWVNRVIPDGEEKYVSKNDQGK